MIMGASDETAQQEAPPRTNGAAATAFLATGFVVGCAATAVVLWKRQQPEARSMLERMLSAPFPFSESLFPSTTAMKATAALEQQAQQQQQQVQAALLQFKQDLRQEIQQDVANTTSLLLASSFQSQERELTKVLSGPMQKVVTHGETMQSQLRELSNLFVAPQSRGAFGELQLELVLREVLPSTAYKLQQTLSNGKRVDCLLNFPSPIGKMAIDSKFPIITHAGDDPLTSSGSASPTPANAAKSLRRKEIQDKLSKHVNDIATKYIIPGETADSAILFLPSVALFLEIVEQHSDLVLRAHKSKVWLACPTTLAAVLVTLQGVSRGMVVAQQTEHVTRQIHKLSKDVDLLVNRFEAAERSVEKTRTELSKMQTSVHKIRKIKLELDALSTSTSITFAASDDVRPTQEDVLLDSNTIGVELKAGDISATPKGLENHIVVNGSALKTEGGTILQ